MLSSRTTQEDQDCSLCLGERETVEHFIVECRKFEEEEEERHRLITLVVEPTGAIGEIKKKLGGFITGFIAYHLLL